jgi:hypothetical protein
MTPPSITQIFNKFAGREIPMIETSRTIDIGGKAYTIDDVKFADANDPTVQEMKKTAEDHGLHLRLFWPSHSMGTMDYRTNRVNAHIEKGADGKYRVSSQFSIG